MYSILVKKNTKILAREIAPLVGAARYSVDNALHDLQELGVVFHEQTKIRPTHRRTLDYWSVDTPVIGILRLIPQQYFNKESS